MQFLVKLECYFNAMFSPAAMVAGALIVATHHCLKKTQRSSNRKMMKKV